MLMSQYERETLKYLGSGPLTAGELAQETNWPRTAVESALRLLLARGKISVTEVRKRGFLGGSGRPARVYQVVSQ